MRGASIFSSDPLLKTERGIKDVAIDNRIVKFGLNRSSRSLRIGLGARNASSLVVAEHDG